MKTNNTAKIAKIAKIDRLEAEFVTFFAKVKSWSHRALFVWDLICCGKRIASNCARFYRIAKVSN